MNKKINKKAILTKRPKNNYKKKIQRLEQLIKDQEEQERLKKEREARKKKKEKDFEM